MEELPSPHHMEALCSSEHCGDANWPGGLLEEDMDVNLFDFAMDLNEGVDLFGQSAGGIEARGGPASVQHAGPQVSVQRASKETIRIERTRERNRRSQARYRQKAKVRTKEYTMFLQARY